MFNLIKKFLCIISLFSFSYATEIKIGMTADFSGSISYLGENMKKGIETYFHTHNKNSNDKYKLISYDDEYKPLLASKYVKRLIFKDKVHAILGSVGTPTANVVLPIIKENKIPFVASYSGGNILRNKNDKYIFNLRASYTQEAYFITKKLLDLGIKEDEIAVFSQNDTYGDSGYLGVLKAILDNGNFTASNIAHERYTKDTNNIELGLSKLLDWNKSFKAIIVVGVNKATIKFINYAKEDFPNAKFFLLSPVNIKEVVKQLPTYREDIYTTLVLPPLKNEGNLQVINEFKKAYELKYGRKDYNQISFEGYLAGKLLIKAIGKDTNSLSKNSIYEALNNLHKFDLGFGFKSDFNNPNSQYSDRIWIGKINKNFELVLISNDVKF